MRRISLVLLACILGGCALHGQKVQSSGTGDASSLQTSAPNPTTPAATPPAKSSPRLGTFSMSLAVKDLETSRAFYEKLGFRIIGGDKKHYLILQNDQDATIGLFQGMFKGNILTFNPGWDRTTKTLPDYDDVREIQKILTQRGITLNEKADEKTTGPAYITLTDPDGNQILIDQHVPAPKR